MKRTVFLLLSMLIGILFVFSACKTLEPDESSSRQESGMPPQPPAFPFGPGAVQTTGKTVKSSLSLSNGAYLTVSADGSTVATVKMPYTMTAYVVYLGSSSATISSISSSSQALDQSGVYWS